MWKLANMIWRIGDLIGFDEQLTWTLAAGFDGIGFHASAGVPGQWQGIEPSECNAQARNRLRQLIGQFSFSEIHAPFEVELRTENLMSDIHTLMPVLELAGDLGTTVLTVHAQIPDSSEADVGLAAWLCPMRKLDAEAGRRGIVLGLEVVEGFDAVRHWGLPNVGVTLDIGHLHVLEAGRRLLASYGGIGAVIRHLGDLLVHLHVHDVRDGLDHCEIGTGTIEFREIIAALKDIGYRRAMCLELNPDRVSPEGIRRSKEYLSACFRD